MEPESYLVIDGDPEDARVRELLKAAYSQHLPFLTLMGTRGPVSVFAQSLAQPGAPPSARLCINMACHLPLESPDLLRQELKDFCQGEARTLYAGPIRG
jgi:uncharacterized protein YyaL (SSP411 family)